MSFRDFWSVCNCVFVASCEGVNFWFHSDFSDFLSTMYHKMSEDYFDTKEKEHLLSIISTFLGVFPQTVLNQKILLIIFLQRLIVRPGTIQPTHSDIVSHDLSYSDVASCEAAFWFQSDFLNSCNKTPFLPNLFSVFNTLK